MGFIGWAVAALMTYVSYRFFLLYRHVCKELELAGVKVSDLENELQILTKSYRLLNTNMRRMAHSVTQQLDDAIENARVNQHVHELSHLLNNSELIVGTADKMIEITKDNDVEIARRENKDR